MEKLKLSSISKEELKSEVEKLSNGNPNTSLLIVKDANEWINEAKVRPIPKMLFDEFWFEGEVCILFADTNVGKSILAVQIADSISSGNPIFGLKMEANKQLVLYFDFELSDKQFENRYSVNYNNHYSFDENLKRVELNPDAEIPENSTFESILNHSLEEEIKKSGAKILIIDNITYLRNETEKAKDALTLMKMLKALKKKHSLSLLVLAHTPKRDTSRPITKNDLSGSSALMSFCDSSFAIGHSQKDTQLRYIKQIKVRQNEFKYDMENVCLFQIMKPINFLEFRKIGYANEQEHLKVIEFKEKEQRLSEAMEMKKQGIPNTEIAKSFGVSEGAVRKWLKSIDIED